MANILQWFVPKELKFFDGLKEQSENSLNAAKELKRFIYRFPKLSYDSKKKVSKSIKRIEQKGDDIAHTILAALDNTFITPIDKEDIHQMVHLLDDVTDLIESVSARIVLFNIGKVDTYIKQLVDVVMDIVMEVDKGVHDLKELKRMEEWYIKIHSLENKSDRIYKEALYKLFNNNKNTLHIIKYKEIYELLEKINDKCEIIANVVESIVIKHA